MDLSIWKGNLPVQWTKVLVTPILVISHTEWCWGPVSYIHLLTPVSGPILDPVRKEKDDMAFISLFYQRMFESLLYTRNTL